MNGICTTYANVVFVKRVTVAGILGVAQKQVRKNFDGETGIGQRIRVIHGGQSAQFSATNATEIGLIYRDIVQHQRRKRLGFEAESKSNAQSQTEAGTEFWWADPASAFVVDADFARFQGRVGTFFFRIGSGPGTERARPAIVQTEWADDTRRC